MNIYTVSNSYLDHIGFEFEMGILVLATTVALLSEEDVWNNTAKHFSNTMYQASKMVQGIGMV